MNGMDTGWPIERRISPDMPLILPFGPGSQVQGIIENHGPGRGEVGFMVRHGGRSVCEGVGETRQRLICLSNANNASNDAGGSASASGTGVAGTSGTAGRGGAGSSRGTAIGGETTVRSGEPFTSSSSPSSSSSSSSSLSAPLSSFSPLSWSRVPILPKKPRMILLSPCNHDRAQGRSGTHVLEMST